MYHELVSVVYIYMKIMEFFYLSYDFEFVVYELVPVVYILMNIMVMFFHKSYDFASIV